MTAPTKAKPNSGGYHTVTPYLVVEGADKVIGFLKKAFGATESERFTRPDGKVGHAEVRIGDSVIMISEAGGGPECVAAPGTLYVMVEDADATYARALKAGGTSVMEPADMFWGHRWSAVKDQSGNTWQIATFIEEVAPDELKKRAAAAFAGPPPVA